jgi:hypothetical protein
MPLPPGGQACKRGRKTADQNQIARPPVLQILRSRRAMPRRHPVRCVPAHAKSCRRPGQRADAELGLAAASVAGATPVRSGR